MGKFDDVMARLSADTRSKIKLANEIPNEKLELPSIGITRALGGGFRYGSQNTIWGNRSGGKSLFALGAIAQAQKEGRVCAYIDTERALTADWALRLGVDTEHLVTSNVGSIEHATDAIIDMMRSGIDVIVIDSISALLPGSYFDDSELKGLGGTNQIGQFARDMGRMTAMFNYTNESSIIILISQVRTDLGGYHASLKPMGGKATEHYNTTSIRLWSTLSEKDAITADISEGDRIYNKAVGRPVAWTLDKARGAGMGMSGKYDIYFDGPFVGVDRVGETVDMAVEHGKIIKAGAWFTIYSERLQGRSKAVEYVRSNPEVLEKLTGELL